MRTHFHKGKQDLSGTVLSWIRLFRVAVTRVDFDLLVADHWRAERKVTLSYSDDDLEADGHTFDRLNMPGQSASIPTPIRRHGAPSVIS